MYIKLQDLTDGMKQPCMLDIKIGLGKPGKNKTYPTTEVLKFRLCGMSIQLDNGLSLFRDKYWGRKLTIESVAESLSLFFSDGINLLIFRKSYK